MLGLLYRRNAWITARAASTPRGGIRIGISTPEPRNADRLSDIIGEILYGRPLQLTCNKMQQNDYSVVFSKLVPLKTQTFHAEIITGLAL